MKVKGTICLLGLFSVILSQVQAQRLDKIELSLAIAQTDVVFLPEGRISGNVGSVSYELDFLSGSQLDSVLDYHMNIRGFFGSLEIERDISQFRLRKYRDREHESVKKQTLPSLVRSLYLRGIINKEAHDALINRSSEDEDLLEEVFAKSTFNYNFSRVLNASITTLSTRVCNTTRSWQEFPSQYLLTQEGYTMEPFGFDEIIASTKVNSLSTLGQFMKIFGTGSISLPPNQCASKLYIYPPLDPLAKRASVYVEGSTERHDWSIQQVSRVESSNASYYPVRVINEVGSEGLDRDNSVFAFIGTNSDKLVINNNEVLIPEGLVDSEFTLVSVAIIDDKAYVGSIRFVGTDFIDMEKLRVQPVTLKYVEIN